MLTHEAFAIIEAELAKGVKGAPQRGGKAITRNRYRGRAALYEKTYNPDQPRDDSGKWTAADAQAEHAAGDAMRAAGVRDYRPDAGSIRGAFRALATAAHTKAQQLAAGIRHIV